MKRLLAISTLCFATLSPALWAIPTTITYQGTLKENGLPVNISKKMTFQITDQADSTLYWTSGQLVVPVNNGLFSVQLTPILPPGVTWDAITPYIQVSVEGQALSVQGQTLSQGEPINATTYALMANGVVDGAITVNKILDGAVMTNKLANGAVTSDKLDPATAQGYLVPPGAIMIFENSCPSGWTPYTKLQGRFPVGADPTNPTQFAVGYSSGSLTHSHTFTTSTDGAHTHNISSIETIPTTDPKGSWLLEPQPTGWTPTFPGETTDSEGAHHHTGTTDSASSLPPYLTVVFCQKN